MPARPWSRLSLAISLGTTVVLSNTNCRSSPVGQSTPPSVTIVLNAPTMASRAFNPNPFTISLAMGGTVTWGNADYTAGGYGGGGSGTTHTVTSDTGLWDSGDIAPNSRFQFTFTMPGTYTYHCKIHNSMVGTIIVTP